MKCMQVLQKDNKQVNLILTTPISTPSVECSLIWLLKKKAKTFTYKMLTVFANASNQKMTYLKNKKKNNGKVRTFLFSAGKKFCQ